MTDLVQSDDKYLDNRRVYDPDFLNFKVSFKLLELDSDVKTKDIKWADEFTHDEQFDMSFETKGRTSANALYENIPFSVDPENDLILVRIQGVFDPKHAQQVKYAEL